MDNNNNASTASLSLSYLRTDAVDDTIGVDCSRKMLPEDILSQDVSDTLRLRRRRGILPGPWGDYIPHIYQNRTVRKYAWGLSGAVAGTLMLLLTLGVIWPADPHPPPTIGVQPVYVEMTPVPQPIEPPPPLQTIDHAAQFCQKLYPASLSCGVVDLASKSICVSTHNGTQVEYLRDPHMYYQSTELYSGRLQLQQCPRVIAYTAPVNVSVVYRDWHDTVHRVPQYHREICLYLLIHALQEDIADLCMVWGLWHQKADSS